MVDDERQYIHLVYDFLDFVDEAENFEKEEGLVFRDPERHEEWTAFLDPYLNGKPSLGFRQDYTFTLWSPQDPPADLPSVSDEELAALFRGSYRHFRYGHEIWRVWWEEQDSMEIWTMFRSPRGELRVLESNYPFPFVNGPAIYGAAYGARIVTAG